MAYSIFGKKEASIKVVNKVWIDTATKLKACSRILKEQPATIFITWFDDTFEQLQTYLQNELQHDVKILPAREAGVHSMQQGAPVFVGHHPLKSKEQQLFERLALKEAVIYCSLDEAFFEYFGGERIRKIVSTLGLKEDECIEHSMISAAIEGAQEKIEKRMLVEQSARSQKEWMERNVRIDN